MNGSVETIKKIISYLNEAKLDPKTGESPHIMGHDTFSELKPAIRISATIK